MSNVALSRINCFASLFGIIRNHVAILMNADHYKQEKKIFNTAQVNKFTCLEF